MMKGHFDFVFVLPPPRAEGRRRKRGEGVPLLRRDGGGTEGAAGRCAVGQRRIQCGICRDAASVLFAGLCQVGVCMGQLHPEQSAAAIGVGGGGSSTKVAEGHSE